MQRAGDALEIARSGDLTGLQLLLDGVAADLAPDVTPILQVAAALTARAEFDKADDVLTSAMAAAPNHFQAFEAWAQNAYQKRDWAEMRRRWAEVCDAFPDRAIACVWLAAAHTIDNLNADGERILLEGMAKFPGAREIARDYARLPLRQENFEEALARITAFRHQFPDDIAGYSVGAETLRLLGRFQEAEDLLESVRDQFAASYHFMFEHAWNAARLANWNDCFARWDRMLVHFPNAKQVLTGLGDCLMLWQLAKSEGDSGALTAQLPPAVATRAGSAAPAQPQGEPAPLTDRELMMCFEGLGDQCEFGLVQRHFGAEPIGLLRWSGIETGNLITLLRTRLDGVGERDNTFVRLAPDSREYFAGDNRYFYMHTFIKANEVKETDVFEKFRSRLSYLKRKLVEDLETGDKIFVYKTARFPMTDDQSNEIATVLKEGFPAARIMLMRVTDDPETAGTIAPITQNAIFGYLTSFYETRGGISQFDEWRNVCAAALKHFRG